MTDKHSRNFRGRFPSFDLLVPARSWVRDPELRSWPVLMLVALFCIPSTILLFVNEATESDLSFAARLFSYYFAIAWLLLLGVIIRPRHVTRAILASVVLIGTITQVPIAIALETSLHANTNKLLNTIFTVGFVEELSKMVPVLAIAWIGRRRWQSLTPKDYLFLGAVSGLVFGSTEVEHYFTVSLGSLSGNINGLVLQDLTIEYVWRFVTDPIVHAAWAGISGYFIGIALAGPRRRYAIGLIGIIIASILHGLYDWSPINGHPVWILVQLVSIMLFLSYSRARDPLMPPVTPTPPGVQAAEAIGPELRGLEGSKIQTLAASDPGEANAPESLTGGDGNAMPPAPIETSQEPTPAKPWWQQ